MSAGRTGCLDPAVINEEGPFSWVGHLEDHHLNLCWGGHDLGGHHRGHDLGGHRDPCWGGRLHLGLEKDLEGGRLAHGMGPLEDPRGRHQNLGLEAHRGLVKVDLLGHEMEQDHHRNHRQ